MKKFLSILFVLAWFTGMAQTTSTTAVVKKVLPTLDTARVTTTTTVTTNISNVYDTLKYKPPVPVGLTYIPSPPIIYQGKSNFTISGLSFGSGSVLITLNGCSNVHIKKCRFSNSLSYAIQLINGCSNITIDSCFFTNIDFGVYAQNAKGIKINNNQCLNLKWVSGGFSHFAQFDNVNGGGSQINYNRIENIAGVAVQPHDIINVYESNGLPGDSIQVIGNWIRGGQLSLNSTRINGAAGIVLGDVGGSYQVARGNILVNPGYVGIQVQGNSTHIADRIKVDHNVVYSVQTPVSLLGLASAGIGSNVFMGYNQIQWLDYNGHQDDQWYNGTQPQGINTNKLNVGITQSVLPVVIITMK